MTEPVHKAYFEALKIIVMRDKEIEKLTKERDLWKRMYINHDEDCCLSEHLFDCGGLHSTIASFRKQVEKLETEIKRLNAQRIEIAKQ